MTIESNQGVHVKDVARRLDWGVEDGEGTGRYKACSACYVVFGLCG